MRRFIPVALICSIFVFLVATAPAQAAPLRPASQAIPQKHNGTVCRTVHSNVHNRTGVICFLINANDAVADQLWQAMVTFQAKSGTLNMVRVNHLDLIVDAAVAESINFRTKLPSSKTTGFISTAWYSVFHKMGLAQTHAYKTCMDWTDGGVACVNGWANSKQVLFQSHRNSPASRQSRRGAGEFNVRVMRG